MAITVRLTEEQEEQLQDMMELLKQATKSGAIIYMIENSKEIIKNHQAFCEIKRLEAEVKELEKMIAKVKTGKH
ncbi:hypothetical protein [Shewanella xiamenensis]|uniref:hypothetical protein n=1 Tax=Shewanella xiamenensis TaxID=332186 RepID=UPI0024A69213|nr:hypothetical protein [Shewanella xiamenensis]MDI5854077.1 hypothetical protein [Shewanella xiamenensis]MDI5858064.1 hypothetical protein [Shewanella xiamenensis]MDI5866102.1 hypothetical protein [Shewanella xiamenensis]MDI5869969.1 hypothetical protein [Shewanella xiamenensis]